VKAWQAGWVRWFVLYGELKMETSEKISPELITTVTQGIKNITKLASDPNKIRHFFDDDEDTLPVYIWTYTLDGRWWYFLQRRNRIPTDTDQSHAERINVQDSYATVKQLDKSYTEMFWRKI
jgi:hypothetical protein